MGAMRKRGNGTVYRRGRIWWIQYFVRGLIVPESSHSTEKADAENLLKQRIGEVAAGRRVRAASRSAEESWSRSPVCPQIRRRHPPDRSPERPKSCPRNAPAIHPAAQLRVPTRALS